MIMSLRVMFQHIIFLNFISFLRNYIPIVFPVNNSKNFDIIFVKCHCLIHDIAHLSAFTLNILRLGLLELLIKFVVLFLLLVNFFLFMLIYFHFWLRMVIKPKVMVKSFICYNLSKASWRGPDLRNNSCVKVWKSVLYFLCTFFLVPNLIHEPSKGCLPLLILIRHHGYDN